MNLYSGFTRSRIFGTIHVAKMKRRRISSRPEIEFITFFSFSSANLKSQYGFSLVIRLLHSRESNSCKILCFQKMEIASSILHFGLASKKPSNPALSLHCINYKLLTTSLSVGPSIVFLRMYEPICVHLD